ncbi:MAG: preprotein translocase subunit SecE [Pseudomonadota bacterium]
MAGKIEVQDTAFDAIKLATALVLLAVGVGVFYYYSDQSQLYRVLGLLVVTAVAIGIALTTGKGQYLWGFLQESRVEVRKMVWPNRAETVQTTLMVFVVILVVGIFLWLLDMLLSWIIRFVIG